MFLLIANRKESEKIVTEKEDKKLPHIYLVYFLSFFYGRKTNPPFLTATHSISEEKYIRGGDFPFLYIF